MKRIDLNADLGEGGAHDGELLRLVTGANVCCGEHAGSWEVTLRTVAECRRLGIAVGAHPGFPDRDEFGRKPPSPGQAEAWRDSILEQALRFGAECAPDYLKPHGAFYGLAVHESFWEDALAAALSHAPACLGLAGNGHERAAARVGRRFAREGFADRMYAPDGTLAPRDQPGAVLTALEDVRAQALAIAPSVDSICLHGDTPGCVELARALRDALEGAGYQVRRWA